MKKASSNRRVIYIALVGNLIIAVAKFKIGRASCRERVYVLV